MKERPILFSTPMVQAILEGRKSQTRRVIKYQPPIDTYRIVQFDHEVFMSAYPNGALRPFHYQIKNRFGHKGDILWVRETFLETYSIDDKTHYEYKADYSDIMANDVCWKPSIFMPKAACRIKLEVTDVRVEKVQDISEADAKAEGVLLTMNQHKGFIYENYHSAYVDIWESINGKGSWEKNSWVWVIKFKTLCTEI